VAQRRIDLTELAKRVRRRGLLRALAEGPPPTRSAPPPPLPKPPEVQVEPAVEARPEEKVEVVLDPIVAQRLRACTLSCSAAIVGLADLPGIESGGRPLDVALLRLRVRRPEGDAECCVRQHIPAEIRGVVGPGAGVMVLAHEHDRAIAAVDWAATGEWIGAKLTFPSAHDQYDWPDPEEWPQRNAIEVHDVNGYRAKLDERRADWRFASAGLVSLAPLPSRSDSRDEWEVALQLGDGRTVELKDRVPLLALARLRAGDGARVGTPIDILVSEGGDVAVDWEATLRQPELRWPRS
jgi:hypothetical protein